MTPAPISRIASRTLTAAMIPSRRFVVSRFPAFIPSLSSVRRTGAGIGRLRPRRVELVHRTDAVVGHRPELFDGSLELAEFAPQIVHGGLELVAQLMPPVRKEEVTHGGARNRADNCACDHHSRLVHTPLLRLAQRYPASKTGATGRKTQIPNPKSQIPNLLVGLGLGAWNVGFGISSIAQQFRPIEEQRQGHPIPAILVGAVQRLDAETDEPRVLWRHFVFADDVLPHDSGAAARQTEALGHGLRGRVTFV